MINKLLKFSASNLTENLFCLQPMWDYWNTTSLREILEKINNSLIFLCDKKQMNY